MKRDSKQEKVYRSFVKHLEENVIREKRSWRIKVSNLDSAIQFWKNLSYADKKRLVSSTRWNHYPAQCWTYHSKKPYGEVVGNLIRSSIMFNPRDRDILIKNSEGVFAVYAFDDAEAQEKMKLSKRLFNSPDKRVKLRAIEYSSTSVIRSNLGKAIERKDHDAIHKMVSKIGIVNCYKQFIPDTLDNNFYGLSWYERKAVSLAERSEVAHLDSEIESCGDARLVASLLKKMPAQKALFYMNNIDRGRVVSDIIRKKLENV